MEGEGYGVKHSKRGKDGSSELITKKLMKRYNFFFRHLWSDLAFGEMELHLSPLILSLAA